jgi:hypothetical protein
MVPWKLSRMALVMLSPDNHQSLSHKRLNIYIREVRRHEYIQSLSRSVNWTCLKSKWRHATMARAKRASHPHGGTPLMLFHKVGFPVKSGAHLCLLRCPSGEKPDGIMLIRGTYTPLAVVSRARKTLYPYQNGHVEYIETTAYGV